MPDIARIAVALLFAALLLWQSRGMTGRPSQRRAFQVAAVAMLLAAALNAAAGADPIVQALLGGAVLAALIVAAVLFARGYFAGEMRAPHRRATDMARAYREERERETGDRAE